MTKVVIIASAESSLALSGFMASRMALASKVTTVVTFSPAAFVEKII